MKSPPKPRGPSAGERRTSPGEPQRNSLNAQRHSAPSRGPHENRRPAVETRAAFARPKPSLLATTLWDFPSQNYGDGKQGDTKYVGASPSYVIWNLISRYTQPGDIVVDPMCGSGTTIDVANDLNRVVHGFDLNPVSDKVVQADARKLPLKASSANLVFIDPPYGDHIDYSADPKCIGKLSAYQPGYYDAMRQVFREAHRVLKPQGVLAVYVCDAFDVRRKFAPIGFQLFALAGEFFSAIDVVSVVRHNKSLDQANHRKAAVEQNFFLRGFNYLMIFKRER